MAFLVAIAEFCTSFDRIDDSGHTALKPLLDRYPALPLVLRGGNVLQATRYVSTGHGRGYFTDRVITCIISHIVTFNVMTFWSFSRRLSSRVIAALKADTATRQHTSAPDSSEHKGGSNDVHTQDEWMSFANLVEQANQDLAILDEMAHLFLDDIKGCRSSEVLYH